MAKPLSSRQKWAIRLISTVTPPILFLTLTPDWAMSAIAQAYIFSYAGSWATGLAQGTMSLFMAMGGFAASDLTIGACCDKEEQIAPAPIDVEMTGLIDDDLGIAAQETGNTIEIQGYYHYPRLFEHRKLPIRATLVADEPSTDYHPL